MVEEDYERFPDSKKLLEEQRKNEGVLNGYFSYAIVIGGTIFLVLIKLYVIAATLGCAMLISAVASNTTKVFSYDISEEGWKIKWVFLNQAANIFSWVLVGCGFLASLYFETGNAGYKKSIIGLGVMSLLVFIWYLYEKKTEPEYLSFDKKTNELTQGKLKVKLDEIEKFEFHVWYGKSDGDENVGLYIHQKNGKKIYLNTAAHSTNTQRWTYLELAQKLPELTGIPCEENTPQSQRAQPNSATST